MIIKDMPVSERPREKLLRCGTGSLSNRELLAILLGSGTRKRSALEIADELLAMDSRGLRNLGDVSCQDLSEISGIGDAKATLILAALELGKRIASGSVNEQCYIRDTSDVLDICMEKMRYHRKEYFNAILVNVKGMVICEENISIGDLSGSIVHPREAFRSAVNKSAAAVIFVHNHPSGDPSPSLEDINITSRLCEAGRILGIRVYDHIIIGDGKHVSLKAEGYIEE